MNQLIKIIREDVKITSIKIATPFAEEHYDMLLHKGFSITDVPKDIARFLKMSTVASINRAEFLGSFDDEKEKK